MAGKIVVSVIILPFRSNNLVGTWLIVVLELTSQVGGGHGVGSNLGVAIFVFCTFFCFFHHIFFPLACFPLFSLLTLYSFPRF